jgi:hypothetical protein
MQAWILTFNRPAALNRQIETLGPLGYDIFIFSNHPTVKLTDRSREYVKGALFNTLSDEESNSYCSRSWNNIFIKCFKQESEAIFVQDDTLLLPSIGEVIESNKSEYDLIWGPAGDTFFYMKKSVLKSVGWFDERYLGCYCGDADFLKRCWMNYDRNRLSVSDSHDWGFIHNDVGLANIIGRDISTKRVDQDYINQHEENEAKMCGDNYILSHSQSHFKKKWDTPGNGLNNIGPIINWMQPSTMEEIDWYPWFTKKYLNT